MISEDAKSAEILKPILRGRDIQRYQAQWAGLWLIATFPSLRINIENYPAIKRYLLSYGKDRLEQTGKSLPEGGKARKKTPHRWFELQDTCAYHAEFAKEKLLWMQMSDKGRFTYSKDGLYCNQKAFIITGRSLKYLCAMLNSKLVTWLTKNTAVTTGLGLTQWDKFTVETIPIPKISTTKSASFIHLVDSILSLKAANPLTDTTEQEREIDHCVYLMYDLTNEEISTVETD